MGIFSVYVYIPVKFNTLSCSLVMLECIDQDFSCSFEKISYNSLFHFSQEILLSAGEVGFNLIRGATANSQITLTASDEPGTILSAMYCYNNPMKQRVL